MDGSAHFLLAQGDDDALDLPPVAEAHDIALVAAVLGARRRFKAGVVALGFDEQRGIHECRASGDEGHVHGRPLTRRFLQLGA